MSNYYLGHTASELDSAIDLVLQGYKDVSPVTATEDDVLLGKVIVDSDGNAITGVINTVNVATPVISVGEDGLITVTLIQPTGYVVGDTITSTYQLPTHSGGKFAKEEQTIFTAGKFMLDDIIIRTAPTYSVSPVSGASYGFALNSSGYYESDNQGVNSSAALCRVTFTLPDDATVTFTCINYAENNYDYGIFGVIDTALDTTYTADSTYHYCFKGLSSESEQTVTYDMTAGTHFVDVKFRKDSSSSYYNDSLQFKITFN